MTNGFVIAGTNSGCGKTTVTIGLMRLLMRKGYSVAPFKTGPDYIDPAFHSMATQTDSHNLDSWILEQEAVQALFHKYAGGRDFAIVEGVMGMYDGLGEAGLGSTAELARIIDLPVVLVVNCKALYQSVGAIVDGFVNFDKRVRVAGVILNHVYSDTQFAFLKQFIEKHCGVNCLGYLPPNGDIALESRHLGLIQAGEVGQLLKKIDLAADLLEQHCNIDKLLEATRVNCPSAHVSTLPLPDLSGLRIGVARDKAFSFYYKANLDLLKESGAELVYFSPIKDSEVPANVNALYLGGGYPEVFARELSTNKGMRENIRQLAEDGLPIYAECGGLMYLTEGIAPVDGEFFPMCGIFNCKTEMTARLQNFGYCLLDWDGATARAHEFHHSKLIANDEASNYEFAFDIQKPELARRWQGGLRHKNVLAGYPHIHFYANLEFYKKIVVIWKKQDGLT